MPRIFSFKYRGGEIRATVVADSPERARQKLDAGECAHSVEYWYLHPEFWEAESCPLEEDKE